MRDTGRGIHIWHKERILIKHKFINNNTFSNYWHSKGEVLQVRPSLPRNMLQCQRWRWCDMVLPNLALVFPMQGSLPSPRLCAAPGHLGPKVLSLHGHHNLASAFVGNEPIEPLRFPFFHQSSPDLLPSFHRCLLDWMSLFSSLGTRTPKGWLLQLHKSLKKGFLRWTYEAWSCTSRVHAEALPPICLLHHPISSSIRLIWLYSQLQLVHSLKGKPE